MRNQGVVARLGLGKQFVQSFVLRFLFNEMSRQDFRISTWCLDLDSTQRLSRQGCKVSRGCVFDRACNHVF